MKVKRTLYVCLVALIASGALVEAQPASTQQISNDFRQVAKTAIPAVVSIRVKGTGNNLDEDEDSDTSSSLQDNFWEKFFNLPNRKSDREDSFVGQASGFIVSPDGNILTNSHVVKGMSEITVILHDGKEYKAKVIGQDPNTDVALIHIDAKDLPYLKLGNSDQLDVGQWVVAIGNPMGLQASLTAGVVSAKGRNNLDLSRIEDYIQTDAAINRGNSGGPLLDMDSQVVGMNTAIVTNMANGGYMGIGFAIPSNILNVVMQDLKSDGAFQRGYIGVVMQQIDDDLAKAFHLDKTEGALVTEVAKNSPAEKGGIKQGDVILKYNNLPVNNIAALRNAVSLMKPGTKLNLALLRDGKPVQVQLEIAPFPNTQAVAASVRETKLGIEVKNLPPEMADKEGKGVIISKVESGSPISWAGVKKGALILQVNRAPVASVDEFNKALQATKEGQPILLLIKQEEITRYISIRVG